MASGGTSYEDEDGNVRYADEYLEEGNFTVGSAWGALRRCWTGYRIAKGQDDYEKMVKYAKAIQRLQRLLNISRTEFPDLVLDDAESQYLF